MSAEVIAQLILAYGVPFAQAFWKMMTQAGGPTDADWAALTALAAKRAQDQMQAALARAGIAPDSAQGKALLGLTP